MKEAMRFGSHLVAVRDHRGGAIFYGNLLHTQCGCPKVAETDDSIFDAASIAPNASDDYNTAHARAENWAWATGPYRPAMNPE